MQRTFTIIAILQLFLIHSSSSEPRLTPDCFVSTDNITVNLAQVEFPLVLYQGHLHGTSHPVSSLEGLCNKSLARDDQILCNYKANKLTFHTDNN